MNFDHMEVCFITKLEVEEKTDNTWLVTQPFIVTIDGQKLEVPAGFETDFASVPRLPFTYWLFGNIAHRPAVVHDWLYNAGGTDEQREYADNVLYHAMLADGVAKLRAKMVFQAVRSFGGSHWKPGVKNG